MASLVEKMPHEIAKLLLEHADGFLERSQAIEQAMKLGMPLNEIEEYLDWLGVVRDKHRNKNREQGDGPPSD